MPAPGVIIFCFNLSFYRWNITACWRFSACCLHRAPGIRSVSTRRMRISSTFLEGLEARVGFEPTRGGFADLSLKPLGYRAFGNFSIAKDGCGAKSDWQLR